MMVTNDKKGNKTMWTQFWDMSSGGTQKLDWKMIFIEAPEEEAKQIFYNRFGRNPERVTCTCCGEDYSISEEESLRLATAFHRNCRALETPLNSKTGLYESPDESTPEGKYFKEHYYLEDGEEPQFGFNVSSRSRYGEYLTLEEYEAQDNILVIRADEIKDEERKGAIPDEGYVWV